MNLFILRIRNVILNKTDYNHFYRNHPLTMFDRKYTRLVLFPYQIYESVNRFIEVLIYTDWTSEFDRRSKNSEQIVVLKLLLERK